MTTNVRFETDTSTLSDDSLAKLYEAVGFGTADVYLANREFARRLFRQGVFGFLAYDSTSGELVGMARVMSDDFICSWICELCVAPPFQARGIGLALLQKVLERFGHTAIYAETFPEQVKLFERAGIKPKPKLIACSRAGDIKVPVQAPEPFMH